jgi:hypothetical protein
MDVFSVFQRKRKAKLKSDGRVNGVDPLAEDDDDRLKEIARQFEEKYVSTYLHERENLTLPLAIIFLGLNVNYFSYKKCQFGKSTTL